MKIQIFWVMKPWRFRLGFRRHFQQLLLEISTETALTNFLSHINIKALNLWSQKFSDNVECFFIKRDVL